MTDMPKRSRSIWEATGLPDDIVWYAKRRRTRELFEVMRRGVALIREFLRPYYIMRLDDPYHVAYRSRDDIKHYYTLWDVDDYKGGVVRYLKEYLWRNDPYF